MVRLAAMQGDPRCPPKKADRAEKRRSGASRLRVSCGEGGEPVMQLRIASHPARQRDVALRLELGGEEMPAGFRRRAADENRIAFCKRTARQPQELRRMGGAAVLIGPHQRHIEPGAG